MTLPVSSQPLYTRGDILIVSFPGSGAGASAKRRPAVVMAVVPFGVDADYLCALITSRPPLIRREFYSRPPMCREGC